MKEIESIISESEVMGRIGLGGKSVGLGQDSLAFGTY